MQGVAIKNELNFIEKTYIIKIKKSYYARSGESEGWSSTAMRYWAKTCLTESGVYAAVAIFLDLWSIYFGSFSQSFKNLFVIVLVYCYYIKSPVLHSYALNAKDIILTNKLALSSLLYQATHMFFSLHFAFLFQDHSDLYCSVTLFNSHTSY